MDQDFLVRTLGLTEEEAFLLLRVVSRGQITAAAAARILGKSRGRAYEVLRSLVAAGLVEELPGRPLLYAARPLAGAVAGRRGELEARVAALRQAEEALRRTEAAPPASGPGSVSLYWGVRTANREAARMAQQARRSVLVAGAVTFGGDRPGFELLLLALSRASLGGASVALFLPGLPEAAPFREQAERTLGAGHVVAYEPGQLPDAACFVADDEVLHCLPGFRGEDEMADEALGIKVRSPAFAELVRTSLRALLDARGPSLDESFGAFRRILEEARGEVCTLAGQGWRDLRPEAELAELGRLYTEAAARGVAVRTVVHDDAAAAEAFRLGPGPMRLQAGLPLWLAIVDDAVAFEVSRAEEGGARQARLSRDPSVVRLFRNLFENVWADARPLSGAGVQRRVPGKS
jgi:hypothetical protein